VDLRGNECSRIITATLPPYRCNNKKGEIMIHNYQKRWVFTWNADEYDRLVNQQELEKFLNSIVKEGVFQLEKGEKTGRLHYQGRFELKGPRTGKKQLLKIFSQLGEIKNLTFAPERLYNSKAYCMKVDSRVEGPWFIGTDLYRTKLWV